MSPLLFGLILSGLEPWLLSHPDCGVTVDSQRKCLVSFADDLKLFASSRSGMLSLFALVSHYLSLFGLSIKVADCALLPINSSLTELCIGSVVVPALSDIRFLGLRITCRGTFLPWRDSYDDVLYALDSRLTATGFGHHPAALMKALKISVLPAITFGAEIWALDYVYRVLFRFESPYKPARFSPLLLFLKRKLGLRSAAFYAPVYRLFGLKSLFELVLPRLAKLLRALSPDQWDLITVVASSYPASLCARLLSIASYLAASDHTPARVAFEVVDAFWLRASPLGRHAQFYQVFKAAPCFWRFMHSGLSR